LNTGNIVISGIGNLYIILVFAAAKLIREWYVTDNHKQDLVKRNLYLKRADANASVQPGMLLFSIEKIEEMELAKSEHVPAAIALLSEILNAVMQAQKRKVQRVDEEARIVKRMLKLYAMLLDTVAPGLRIEGEDLSMKSLPAFILFSPLEIVIRHQSLLPEENISIVIEDERSVQISWEASYLSQKPMIIDTLKREMDKLYPDQFYVESHVENDSYSVCILAL
jgi:hypothetical protein